MLNVKLIKIFFILFFLSIVFFVVYSKFFKKEEIITTDIKIDEEVTYNSNIINNVNYTTRDADGNEYIINAAKGETDFSNSNIIFLTEVTALINPRNSDSITITASYGKYNSENLDTIFSKNVIINYLDNKITGEYLDFSLKRSSMIISKNVVYTNLENILKADVIDMNIKTKDTKIFMYEKEKKVNIKNKN